MALNYDRINKHLRTLYSPVINDYINDRSWIELLYRNKKRFKKLSK